MFGYVGLCRNFASALFVAHAGFVFVWCPLFIAQ